MYVRAVYLFSNKEAEEGSELLMGSTLWRKQTMDITIIKR